MAITNAERRQIENEMTFRRINEKAGEELSALDAMYIEDGNTHLVRDEDLVLRFKCECSDENCSTRIPMLLSVYRAIHEDRDTFIVLPDHQVDMIEEVLEKTTLYNVVKKNYSTTEPSDGLNRTTVNNS